MKFLSWRCLPALVALFLLAVKAVGEEAAWSATFSGSEGDSESAAFAVGDGRHLIAIALSGMEAGKGRLKLAGRELPAEVFVDPVSRLVVFRMSGPPGKALPLFSAAPSSSGSALRCGSGGATGRELGQKAGHGVVLGEGFCMEVHGLRGREPTWGLPCI